MNEKPPRQGPDAPQPPHFAADPGSMLTVYGQNSGSESFPVLKAFQDYIEAERAQARKRVVQLSVLFVVLLVLVVSGFLTAGIFVMRNMANMQNKLLDVVTATKEPPPTVVAPAPTPQPIVVQNSPQVEESLRAMSKTAADMQSMVTKQMDGVSEIAGKMHDQVKAQDSELKQLREELKKTQEQSAQLNQELAKIKSVKPPPLVPVRPAPTTVTPLPPTPPAPPATATVAQPTPTAPTATPTAAAATPVAQPPAAPKPPVAAVAPKPTAPVAPVAPATIAAVAPTAPLAATDGKTVIAVDPRFPPATKEPPTPPQGIKAPPPPTGRVATAMPLKSKNSGTIPWRVMIPD